VKSTPAFSLVEVVIAIAVFGVGVVGAIALLSSTTDSASQTLDANGAIRLSESSAALVQQMSWTQVSALLQENSPNPIYANKDGSGNGLVAEVLVEDAYYQVELVRLVDISPPTNDATSGYLAFALEISWPVRAETTGLVPLPSRERFTLNVAVNR
jgi:prepilin-type N-terminal cleavage/methylation domain-containing protein